MVKSVNFREGDLLGDVMQFFLLAQRGHHSTVYLSFEFEVHDEIPRGKLQYLVRKRGKLVACTVSSLSQLTAESPTAGVEKTSLASIFLYRPNVKRIK